MSSSLADIARDICVVRYYEDYEIDEVKGLSNLTQMYTEVLFIDVLTP